MSQVFGYMLLVLVFTLGLSTACEGSPQQDEVSGKDEELVLPPDSVLEESSLPIILPLDTTRAQQVERIRVAKESGKPLVIHAYVPLCDNEHQGIVPTSASLGDGMNLRTNLYWATSYGMRKYFEKNASWKLAESISNPDTNILERVMFTRRVEGANLVLVVDGYRGDRMKECLEDYFGALAGTNGQAHVLDSTKVGIGSWADLIVFNGHNGLMDTYPEVPEKQDSVYHDAVSIACLSKDYFAFYYEQLGAFPYATTTSLLYPGAQVLDEIILEWVKGDAEPNGKNAAGLGYHKMKPKHSVTTCRKMFATGW